MSEFITIGEPLVVFCSKEMDASLDQAVNFRRVVGGAELNVAIGIKRLGHSADYISSLGKDPQGQFIKNFIDKSGVNSQFIQFTDKYLTGYQMKQLVSKGDPFVYNFRKNSAAANLNWNFIKKINFSNIKIAHITGIMPALSKGNLDILLKLLKLLRSRKITVTFDPNLRPALWSDTETMRKTINKIAEYADIVLPGQSEGKILTEKDQPEDIADFYLENGQTKAVFVKVGSKGSYVKTKNGLKEFVPGFKAKKVVDTVGAGDGFALGVISALLEKKNFLQAAQRGNAIGCMQVQVHGDNEGYPTKERLAKFYQETGVNNE